jgi:hypothetical protein
MDITALAVFFEVENKLLKQLPRNVSFCTPLKKGVNEILRSILARE